jgi:hypothetical protein
LGHITIKSAKCPIGNCQIAKLQNLPICQMPICQFANNAAFSLNSQTTIKRYAQRSKGSKAKKTYSVFFKK